VRTFGNPATDAIQLVKVAYSSSNLTITGTVTALPWDGSKGGIVVIETDGTLSLNANINVRGQGFRTPWMEVALPPVAPVPILALPTTRPAEKERG